MLLAYGQYGSATRKDTSLIFLQRCQIFFYSAIIDAQELVGRGHHVDTVGLAFRALLVHELVDRLIHWSVLQDDTHH